MIAITESVYLHLDLASYISRGGSLKAQYLCKISNKVRPVAGIAFIEFFAPYPDPINYELLRYGHQPSSCAIRSDKLNESAHPCERSIGTASV